MRWWMHFDAPCIMSVDNASVAGMDFSELIIDDPDLYMIQWIDGKGEIERQEVIDGGKDDKNLNGLRETFIDVVPYAPLFQQFLTLMQAKALLLPQAKKIQVELIGEIYNAKRQAPFHYPVASGDYWWDASDDSTVTMIPSTQTILTTLNSLITKVNALGNAVSQLALQSNANVIDRFNGITRVELDGMRLNINTRIASPVIDCLQKTNLDMQYVNEFIADYNANAPADYTGNQPVDIPYSNVVYIVDSFSSLAAVSNIAWTDQGTISPPATSWVPIGASEPVPVTAAEADAIHSGISARQLALQDIKAGKVGEVNALTVIQDVIDYDVTAGW